MVLPPFGVTSLENKTHSSFTQKNAHIHNFASNFRRDPHFHDPLPYGDGNGSALLGPMSMGVCSSLGRLILLYLKLHFHHIETLAFILREDLCSK